MPNKMAQNMNLTRASAALRTGLESARKREGAEDAKWDERSAGKPVAAICHAPWSVVEAGEAGGRTMTSWPSLRTDIWNAGAGARSAGPVPGWVDQEVVRSDCLVTSRKPDDLPAFNREMIRLFAQRQQAKRRAA